ncbi:MAG TPA: peptide chain release factor N(5)-glutamine methyltransferase, partial [Chitinophagaceae bacterium]|nr:peptide chain release factor N(5)-glutamine methyltransferase [Chitinophagaceae bacterium]
YVLNESWFCGLKLYVDKNVLIPRPETEELVEWIISNCKFPVDELKILDIGTGSGCIPISVKRRIRKAEVWACEISEDALAVAKRNAATLGTDINFIQLDFLNEEQRNQLPSFDIIVSNPPYVPEKDKEQMQQNVLNYEPHISLFVPDNDALIFYKAIAAFGKEHLKQSGNIYCEIHESLGSSVKEIFSSAGYTIELKKDMQQKDRMIKSGLK